MTLKNNKFEIKVKHVIILVLIIVILILIITSIKDKDDIAYYEYIEDSEIDEFASKKYVQEFMQYVVDKNYEVLYGKLSDDYILYNNLNYDKFIDIVDTELYSNSVSVSNIKKSEYKEKVIYNCTLQIGDNYKLINIIEETPNNWTYTFDDMYAYELTNYENEYNDIYTTIDSIYQGFGYIKLTCYINNRSQNLLDMNTERIDSVQLVLESGRKINLANIEIDESKSNIKPNTMSSRTFTFNIDLVDQGEIESIIFNYFEIDEDNESVNIDLYM